MNTSVRRTEKLIFLKQQKENCVRTDRMFAMLMFVQWIGGICTAVWISPRAWAGVHSSIHVHVLASIFLGGAIAAICIYQVAKHPGAYATRQTIAVSQALFSGLLIHLSGGQIESHFHIFGSLAFLAFYRDKRVLLSYSSIVLLDHLVRGILYPRSIYGVAIVQPWRIGAHAFWVVFINVFLFRACSDGTVQMKAIAGTQAELMKTRSSIEEQICNRTKELSASEHRMTVLNSVNRVLSESLNIKQAAPDLMRVLCTSNEWDCGVLWTYKEKKSWKMEGSWQKRETAATFSKSLVAITPCRDPIVLQVLDSLCPKAIEDLSKDGSLLPSVALDNTMKSALAFPVVMHDKSIGLVLLLCERPRQLDEHTIGQVKTLGAQIGTFIVRKKHEAEVAYLANIVEHANDAVISCDIRGRILTWNQGAKLLYGFSREEMLGKGMRRFVTREQFSEHELKKIVEGNTATREMLHTRKDGSVVDVQCSFSLNLNENGDVVGVTGINRDISERKEAERRINEFYSTVSHELRTPLTSICGALALIDGGFVDEAEEAEMIKVARSSSERLIRLISDMLDLKKLESGKMELFVGEVEPENFVKQTLDAMLGMASDAKVSLHYTVNTNALFQADLDRVTQVLTNLVSNAIKFSPAESSVEVTVDTIDSKTIRFNVIDHGQGIPADQIHKLFGRFQQLDSSDTRAKGGTGLGLAISKSIIEQHGGTIGLESEPGKGSTFWFQLPITVTAEDEDALPPQSQNGVDAPNFVDKNLVLLIEGEDEMAINISAGLNRQGYKCVRSRSLEDARQLLDRQQQPSIVLLDLKLPDGNGLDLVGDISNSTSGFVPILLISNEDRPKENGNTSVRVFPFDEGVLFAAMSKALRQNGVRTVLIVDDDEGLCRVIARQLETDGLNCLQAQDGAEAIKIAQKSEIDLLILDVGMPHVDGFKVIESLKKGKARFTPLIVYSGRDLDPGQREKLKLGDTRYLTKGTVTPEKLLQVVKDLIVSNAHIDEVSESVSALKNSPRK